ncbi:hypothetical protein Leryth_009102 [Lithospermum erythrorhizon]|nr:hypothetical protein Leryth_009102 [Lithospermum erythrorhizon]
MMHMTFYWGREVTILFDSWKTNSWLSYLLSLLVLSLFSIFFQYLEDKRIRFKNIKNNNNPSSETNSTTTPLLSSKISGSFGAKIAGAILFGFNSAIGYLLMLAVMSYNGGVLVAIVVGLAVGYFLFRSSDDEAALAVDNPCACA